MQVLTTPGPGCDTPVPAQAVNSSHQYLPSPRVCRTCYFPIERRSGSSKVQPCRYARPAHNGAFCNLTAAAQENGHPLGLVRSSELQLLQPALMLLQRPSRALQRRLPTCIKNYKMEAMCVALLSQVMSKEKSSDGVSNLAHCLQPCFADAGVEGEDVNLPPTAAFNIGCGFAEWLAKRMNKSTSDLKISVSDARCRSPKADQQAEHRPHTPRMHVQVGRDPRLSGPLLSSALVAGVASRGAEVVQFGLATTPAMYMSCILEGDPADHLPG